MKPLRICLVSKEYPPEGVGGIANYVHLLAHGLAEEGHDVSVIAGPAEKGSRTLSSHVSPHAPELHRVANCQLALPPPIRRKARGIWNLLERSWAVDREIARLERTQGPFDVVEMPNWGAEGLFYSLRPRAPLVIRLSTPLAQVNSLKGDRSNRLGLRLACSLEAVPARRASCIIANSEFIANYCAELYRILGATTVVIPHGIELPASPQTKRKAVGGEVTVLFVGRLERRKGIAILLQAIPEVIRNAPQCRFVIVGDDIGEAPHGATFQEYFNSFASSEAHSATVFRGHVEEEVLSQLYTDCDIFVAPSLSESFGLIYLEAMARAKPVVAFRTGGVPEVVAHEETGILVKLEDTKELARALIGLAEDEGKRQDMGKRGYKRARAKFSVQRMVKETVACFHSLTEQQEE